MIENVKTITVRNHLETKETQWEFTHAVPMVVVRGERVMKLKGYKGAGEDPTTLFNKPAIATYDIYHHYVHIGEADFSVSKRSDGSVILKEKEFRFDKKEVERLVEKRLSSSFIE